MFKWGTYESIPKVFAKKECNHHICLLCINSVYYHQPNVPPQKLCAPGHARRVRKIIGLGRGPPKRARIAFLLEHLTVLIKHT